MKRDFLAISDYSPVELSLLLDLAIPLKLEHFKSGNAPLLRGKVLE